MQALLAETLPHAPQHGLHRAPDIPEGKLRAAIRDYAPHVREADVLALYDGTLFGSARDGVLFLGDRLVYQNNALRPPQAVRYADIVRVTTRKTLLGGRWVVLDVNEARATVTHQLDFSAHRTGAGFVARFLHEAAHAPPEAFPAPTLTPSPAVTDMEAVRAALDRLVRAGRLAEGDRQRMLRAIGEG
jgi:hypothetical protein